MAPELLYARSMANGSCRPPRPIDSGHERADHCHDLRRRVLPRPDLPVVLGDFALGHQRAERASARRRLAVHLPEVRQREQGRRVLGSPPPGPPGRPAHVARAPRGRRAGGQRRRRPAVHRDRNRMARPRSPRRRDGRPAGIHRRVSGRGWSRPGVRRPRRRRVTRRGGARRHRRGAGVAPGATSARRSSRSERAPKRRAASSAR